MAKFFLILALVAFTANAVPIERRTSLQQETQAHSHASLFAAASQALAPSAAVSTRRRGVTRSRVMKRVGQDTTAAVSPWVEACTEAGGADECNAIATASSGALLAAADACAQQDAADAMVDLAKTLNSDPDMIKLATIYAQQPRNTPTSQAVPYCQKAPKNEELAGLFQCQFQSVDQETFVGGLAVGSAGTIPFGKDAPVSPPGSCPASPEIPVPDGLQLLDFIQEQDAGNQ